MSAHPIGTGFSTCICKPEKFIYFRSKFITMRVKTIFIIVITVLVTVILMQNMDEVNFWIFGQRSVPKLAVLGTMFFIGAVVGFLLGRPRKKAIRPEQQPWENEPPTALPDNTLDEDDRDYIS